MKEYEEFGHKSKLIEDNVTNHANYLPISHAVVRSSRTTTKLKVVNDASWYITQWSSNGWSYNPANFSKHIASSV